MKLIFDLETNGLLDVVDRVHCLVTLNIETGALKRYNNQGTADGTIAEGVAKLERASLLIGHNIIGYDLPALKKVFPKFTYTGEVLDTLVLSRLLFPDIADNDFRLIKRIPEFPRNLIGRHSLKAWGWRVGNYKGDFAGPWEVWTQEMEDYCVQDVRVTDDVRVLFDSKKPPAKAVALEHAVARIVTRQVLHGFAVDVSFMEQLYAKLARRRLELEGTLRSQYFPAFFVRDGVHDFVPKRDNAKAGYTAGAPLCKTKLVEFSPSSRVHIANRLAATYGWKPREFTDDGRAKVDETVLAALKYPPVQLLVDYLTVEKRIGQIAEGKQSWLKFVRNGRIHGSVITNGAVTGRMTHNSPNVAQTPKADALVPYGKECRMCWTAGEGKVLVGCDAAALELRDLAGYMVRFDGGAYMRIALEGRKEEGTDVHTVNMRALEIESRDVAKTWFYAWLYGAGDEKLGTILAAALPAAQRPRTVAARIRLGQERRGAFERNLPALAALVAEVKRTAKERGYLIGLDGRHLRVRAEHSALNTLLQSAGAVQMKQALVILDDDLQAAGYVPGVNYEFVANIHDEWQIEVDPEIADDVGRKAAEAIRKAGEALSFKCPLAGEYRVGKTWADTH